MSRFFGLDTRSLGIMRILLSLVILWDAGTRLLWVETFSWGHGINPTSTKHLAIPLVPSLHVLSDALWYQSGLLVVHIALAGLLLLGWKTRLVTPALWFFTLSLHCSNEWVLNGGDYLTRNLLFFCCFVPWGEQYSLEAKKAPRQVAHLGTVALFAQLCLLYWSTAMLKAGPVWTTEASALYYALHMDSFVTGFGESLLAYPRLLKTLTIFTYVVEWTSPILILTALRPLRYLGIALLVGLHLGIPLCLEVGLFWAVPIALVAAFWPWDRVDPSDDEPTLPTFWTVVLSVLLLILTYLNLARLPYLRLPTTQPLYVLTRSMGLHYGWEMFTGLSRQTDGWYLVEAKDSQGRRVDLLWGLPDRYKPVGISKLYPNQRWRRFMLNLKEDRYAAHRQVLVDFVVKRHGEPVEDAVLIYMEEKTPLNYRDTEPEAKMLPNYVDLPRSP